MKCKAKVEDINALSHYNYEKKKNNKGYIGLIDRIYPYGFTLIKISYII